METLVPILLGLTLVLAGGVCGVFAIYTELVRIRKLLQDKEKEPESGTKPEPRP